MRLKRETDYAIRMVDYLARNKETARAITISEEAKVPLRFAKNILQKLHRNEIVISQKGANGGYRIGKEIKEISLYDVLEATDSSLIASCCERNLECNTTAEADCPYYQIFTEMSSELEKSLRGITFNDVIHGFWP